jgi:hypothetical protein
MMTDHEDRNTMMSAAPVIDLLRGPTTRQHCPSRDYFVVQLTSRPRRSMILSIRSETPFMKPDKSVASGIVWFVVRTCDIPVK